MQKGCQRALLVFDAIGLLGIIVLFGMLIAQAVIISVTSTNSLIHDLISSTAVADMAIQKIFNSSEELLEYKNKLHAERVAKSDY